MLGRSWQDSEGGPQFRDVWLPETSFKCITNKPSPFPSTLHSFQASPVPDSRYLAVIVIVLLCYVDSICVFFLHFSVINSPSASVHLTP